MLKNSAIFFFVWCFSCSALSEIVLVTGASNGTGLKIAETLVADMTHNYVVYAGIRPSTGRAGVNILLAKYPTKMRLVDLDLLDSESLQEAIKIIISREGRIDTIINYAGPFVARLEAIIPGMRLQKSGRILQIISVISDKNKIITDSLIEQLKPSNISLQLIEANPLEVPPEEIAASVKKKLEEPEALNG